MEQSSPIQLNQDLKFYNILKTYNLSAVLICMFFIYFIQSTGLPVAYSWFFGVAMVGYVGSYWWVDRGLPNTAFLLFAISNTLLLGVFDGGIDSPVYTFVYHVPFVLCSFIATRTQSKATSRFIWAITVLCIVLTVFTDVTPRLANYLYKPEYYQLVKVCNLTLALCMSLLMVRKILNSANQIELALFKNQQHLQTHENLLNSINQNITEGIYRSTEQNELVYVNNAFASLFGYDSSEELTKLSSPFLYDDPNQRLRLVELIKQQGYFSNEEVLFIRRDGSKFWGQISSILSTDEAGKQCFDGAVRDISKQKQIEAELIQAKNIAEQASLAKSKFLSAMSHEIRTPMNAVIGITNLLAEHKGDLQLQQNNLGVLKKSTQNLMNLLNDLLDFNKIEAGKLALAPAYCDIKPGLDELVSMYTFLANQKHVAFETKIELSDSHLIWADSTRLMQVVSNLLSNAVKFTQRGTVSLTVTQRLNDDGSKCKTFIKVKDTGIGIEPSKHQQIFQVFTQEADETSIHFGGSGLGLAISRMMVEQMESNIYLESAKNQGATFWFEIETQAQPLQASQVSLPPTPISIEGMRILLVEDNPVNVMIAAQILKLWKTTVVVANNGKEAVDRATQEPFDAILMDLHMPELSGIEATRILRQQGMLTPIIALTADALFDSKNECIAAGMNAFITKPFNPDELQQLLASHYKTSSSAALS